MMRWSVGSHKNPYECNRSARRDKITGHRIVDVYVGV